MDQKMTQDAIERERIRQELERTRKETRERQKQLEDYYRKEVQK